MAGKLTEMLYIKLGEGDTAMVHLAGGRVIEASNAIGFSGDRIGLVTGYKDGKAVIEDLVRPVGSNMREFLEEAMIGTGNSRRHFFTRAGKCKIV